MYFFYCKKSLNFYEGIVAAIYIYVHMCPIYIRHIFWTQHCLKICCVQTLFEKLNNKTIHNKNNYALKLYMYMYVFIGIKPLNANVEFS